MIHVFRGIFFTFLLLGTAFAEAPVVPEDFARGMLLETPGRSAFFRLNLPDDLYRDTVRTDMGDIRVFNGADEPVPHFLKPPESSPVPYPSIPAAFFPVYTGWQTPGTPGGEKVSLQINTAEDGTIISVQTGQDRHSGNQRLQALLLDLSGMETAPSGLELQWNDGTQNFVTNVSVDGSQDLSRWVPVVDRAGLAEQHFSGQTLYRNRIPLPTPHRRLNYLRINWPEDAPDLAISEITAVFPDTRSAPERRWLTINGNRLTENGRAAFEFDTGGSFPVDRLNLLLPEKNSLVRAVISSRPDSSSKWRMRQKGLFYNLFIDGDVFSNEALAISPVPDRYWRIEAASGTSGMGGGAPRLEIGWIPRQLLFLARGEGPFTLAYGSSRVGPVDASVENVLHQMEEGKKSAVIGEAKAGTPFDLGGPAALKKSGLPVSWKTGVLWGILLAGVALVGLLAFRLYIQMNRTPS